MTRYYEAEFGLWVEKPDPLTRPACAAIWTGEWDHADGARPRCYRPKDHAGEHRETRRLAGGVGLIEYFWRDDPGGERIEVHRIGSPDGAGPAG
ncbi:MAG TPA: hypothetical protein VMM12_08770 [Longimicrobiales bacterium]|nr:hypothetical protein [Longimicrobiales bacterium]